MNEVGQLAPLLVPHSLQQSKRTECQVGIELLDRGEEVLLVRIEKKKGCSFFSHIWEVNVLFTPNISLRQTVLWESILTMGCWGAAEIRLGVNKLSGTSLIHHGCWVSAKDPTVIRLSFFSAK